MRIASSSSSNGTTTSTGPKISSWAMRMSFVTSTKQVGSMNQPPPLSDRRLPPVSSVAPSFTPRST